MDGKVNTGDDATVELKKALRKNPPRKNPNMSDAEMKLKYRGKKFQEFIRSIGEVKQT